MFDCITALQTFSTSTKERSDRGLDFVCKMGFAGQRTFESMKKGSTASPLGVSVLSMYCIIKDTAFNASEAVGGITGSSTSISMDSISFSCCDSNHSSADVKTGSGFSFAGFKSSLIEILLADPTIPASSRA